MAGEWRRWVTAGAGRWLGGLGSSERAGGVVMRAGTGACARAIAGHPLGLAGGFARAPWRLAFVGETSG